MPEETLTTAQQELYDWLVDFIGDHHHSPSIRQMMQAMGLRSPAPIQSRLRHLQQKRVDKMARRSGKNAAINRREYFGGSCFGSNSCRWVG